MVQAEKVDIDFQNLAVISASSLAAVAIILFFLLKNRKKTWKGIFEEQMFELSYGLMGLTALLDDVVSREKNKYELHQLPQKVALITGGTRGIGKEVIRLLLKSDVHVVIGCRNVKAGEELCKSFKQEGITSGKYSVYELDVSSLASVKQFSTQIRKKFHKIHFLINNAGIMFGPYRESVDGYELQFATNYLGHFLLTHLLLDQIKAAGEEKDRSRIVNVSSCAHLVGEINYDDINNKSNYISSAAYSQSKLAQVLFTKSLDRYFKENDINIEAFCVHPGIVDTDLFNTTIVKKMFPWLLRMIFKTPIQGALPIIYACMSPRLHGKGGSYISNCEIVPSKDITFLLENQEKLFNFTNKLLGIERFGKTE